MQKTTTFLLTILLLITNIVTFAIPAEPGKKEYTQPNGKVLTITLHGDEFVHWAQTTDEYTILQNKEGYYVYAIQDSKGNLLTSDQIAHNPTDRRPDEINFLKAIEKELHFNKSQIDKALNKWGEKKGLEKRGGFPTTGSNNLIMILANFANTSTTYSQTDFDNYMNQENYSGTGSFKDYYLEVSYGQLIMTTVVTAWVTVPNNHDYYGPDTKWGEFARDAVEAADAIVDYSQFDNDGDGDVDGVAIIHQGTGQEASGNTNDIWSHSWNLSSAGYTIVNDGVTVDAYTTQPEVAGSGGISTIGVMCHEFGHNLGAPDFYDTNYGDNGSYSGTGQWDMMAGGSWNNGGATPPHHNPYTKWKYYEWITPTELTSPQPVSMVNSAENSNGFYYYTTPTTGEYWLMENRQQISFDSYIPGHGLLIFHVDEDYINAHDFNNDINVGEHQGLYPVCATATGNPPTTYGSINSGGTPFPGTGSNTEFTDATTPASISWAGANTNKPVTNIAELSNTITFDFMGGGNNPTNFTATASSSTQIDLSWDASAYDGAVLAFSTDATFGTPVDGTTYSAGNTIPGGGTVLYNGTASTFNHSGLQAATTYYYKIWAKEDATPTYTSGVTANEATFCDAITTLPFTEDFSSGALPMCWENNDNAGSGQGWAFNNPGGRTINTTTNANGFAIVDSDNYGSGGSQNADLVSPQFDLSGMASVSLSFEHYFYEYSGSSATLAYSTNGGASWTSIDTWSSSTSNPVTFNQDLTTEVAGESSVKFKWNYTGSYGWYWAVDDIEITGTEIVTNTVTFTVTDNNTSSTIENATIDINSETLTTDVNGQATIDLIDGSYPYTVNMAGYWEATGTASVSGSAVNETVALTPYDPITFTATPTDASCFGSTDGEIAVSSVTGGSGSGFEYSNNGGSTWQASATFTDLPAGDYDIVVKDDAGNQSDASTTTVSEPAVITFTTSVTNTTEGNNDGAIEFTSTTGGSGAGYEYSIDGGTSWQTGTTFTSLASGDYDAVVKDDAGCLSATQTVSVLSPAYTVTFTVTDNTDSHTITDAEISINSQTILTASNGEATIDLQSGTYPYTVNKTGYEEFTGSITVNGAPLAEAVSLVPYDPITFTATPTNVLCNGGSDGSIVISAVAGGSGTGYEYSNTGGVSWQTSATFDGLTAGSYDVQVQDDAGNISDVTTVTLTEPDVITYTINATDETTGNDGSIEFTSVSGGNGAYQYSIDGGTTLQASATFNDLAAGTYTALATDGNGCLSAEQEVTIAPATFVITFVVTDADDSHALIDATISINSTTLTTDANGEATISLVNDDYVYTVTKAGYTDFTGALTVNGAPANENVPLTPVAPVTFSINTTNITCNGESNGEIVFENISGGSGTGYTYSIDNGTTFQSEATFTSLAAGTYNAVAKDGDGTLSDASEVTLTEPDVIAFNTDVTDVSVVGGSDGIIEFTSTTGGNGSYMYSIDAGTTWQPETTFNSLTTGDYTAVVTDANGCLSTQETITVNEPSTTEYLVTFIISENSHPVENASIDITSTTLTTNTDGEATIMLMDGEYPYTTSLAGHADITGSVFVSGSNLNEYISFTGINDVAQEGNIYPNPSAGLFYVEWPGAEQVTVLNALGKIVAEKEIQDESTIDLSESSEGIYLLRIKTDEGITTKRLIINR